ncbi:MAG: hypothetical protein K5896_11540 [Prevotella sp.]|nr:hypothetical protein [Prevotella sp.]
MKKNYVKPQMMVVKLNHRAPLLIASNVNGNAFSGSTTGYSGQGRASELDYIDDEW